MASSKHAQGSASDAAIGCLALIALGVVVSLFSFALEHWETFLGATLVIGALILAIRAMNAGDDRTVGAQRAQEASAEEARRARNVMLGQARQAGKRDMRIAWLEWQIRPASDLPTSTSSSSVSERLAVIPKAGWTVSQLRMHGRAVWALRGGTPGHHLRPEVEARLDRVAAMVSDLTDEEFDTARGQTSDKYLYHPDRDVRAVYLEGGDKGVEVIMDTITAARARAREDAAAKAAAESLAHQRNAALKALRETQQSTEARDAHAAWEEQARRIEE